MLESEINNPYQYVKCSEAQAVAPWPSGSTATKFAAATSLSSLNWLAYNAAVMHILLTMTTTGLERSMVPLPEMA